MARKPRDFGETFADVAAPPPAPKTVEPSQRHDVVAANYDEGEALKRDVVEPVKRQDVVPVQRQAVKPSKDRRNHVSVYVSPKVQLAVRRLALDMGTGAKANSLYVEGIRLVLEKHGISAAEFDRLNSLE